MKFPLQILTAVHPFIKSPIVRLPLGCAGSDCIPWHRRAGVAPLGPVRPKTIRVSRPIAALILSILFVGSLSGTDDQALREAWDRLPAAERAFQAGLKHFQSRKPDAAAREFEKCLRELPRHAFAGYYLANIAYIAGDFGRARELMTRAVADLDFMEALNDYALTLKNKTYDSYTRMIAEEWDSTSSCRTHRELDSLYIQVTDKKSKEELRLAARQAARERQKAHYHYFLGNVLFQLQRFDEAAAAYERAIGLDARHASAYNNLAAIFYMAGDAAKALGTLEKAEGHGLEDNLNLKLKHLVTEALGRPTAGILEEEIAAGPAGDLVVIRFALAFKQDDSRQPPLYENGYLLFSKATRAAVLIDPGVEDPRIEERVRALGLAVRAVLFTHGHPDHFAAGPHFMNLFKAPAFIKAEDAKALPAAPARALADGEVLSYEGLSIEVLHTPGHSRGSVCFRAGGILISGDTLFKGGIGIISTWDEATARKRAAEMVRGIKDRLLVLPDETIVCPGHGRTTTIGAERASNPYLTR